VVPAAPPPHILRPVTRVSTSCRTSGIARTGDGAMTYDTRMAISKLLGAGKKIRLTHATVLIAVAALGVSVWSIQESKSTAQMQAADRTRQAALAEAELIDFVGTVITPTAGESRLQFYIGNYGRLPITDDLVRWPSGQVNRYTTLSGCFELYLSAPARNYPAVGKYIKETVLYYRTPDGEAWARHADQPPYRIKALPERYTYVEAHGLSIPGCTL